MKTLTTHMNEALKIGKDISKFSAYSCQPKNKEELREIIKSRIDKEFYWCDLNDIDTSLITDMSSLFAYSSFTGNISKWDISNVTNMDYMFIGSSFDGDISNWKIPDNCHTAYMFMNCKIKEEHKPKTLQQ